MKRYIATGNTFPHRKTFQNWAWYWDSVRLAWIEDNGSKPDELCIKMAYKLPGVKIEVEEIQ